MKKLKQRMDLMQEKYSPHIKSYTKTDGTPCFWVVFRKEYPPFEAAMELQELFLVAVPALAEELGILKAEVKDGNVFKAMKQALEKGGQTNE